MGLMSQIKQYSAGAFYILADFFAIHCETNEMKQILGFLENVSIE